MFCILLSGPLAGSISICLTWSQNDNNLQFVCSVNELHLSVTLLDPSNRELGFCLPQFFQENCYQHESGVTISQNLFTNETVFSVDKNTYSTINGNWTCQHGFFGDTASVTVNICSCGKYQHSIFNCKYRIEIFNYYSSQLKLSSSLHFWFSNFDN